MYPALSLFVDGKSLALNLLANLRGFGNSSGHVDGQDAQARASQVGALEPMSGESDAEHDTVDQSGVLIGGGQSLPTSGFQAEIAFGPGEVSFNHGAEFQMKTPLADKGYRHQRLLAMLAKIVVNHPARLQNRAGNAKA